MTEDMKTIIITGVLSLITSIITALITSKLTLKQAVKKRIHEKREEAYIVCFELLQSIKDNPFLAFNWQEFYQPLCKLRKELNLFASRGVIHQFEPFFMKAKDTIEKYYSLYKGEEGFTRKEVLKELGDEFGEMFENEKNEYMEKNLIDGDFIETTLLKIQKSMRKDLGSR